MPCYYNKDIIVTGISLLWILSKHGHVQTLQGIVKKVKVIQPDQKKNH